MKNRWNTLKQYFKVEGENIGASCAFLLIGGAVGMILTGLILRLEDVEKGAPMGSLIAAIVTVILLVFLGITDLPRKFNLMVSMGKTRKDLILSNYVFEIVKTAVYLVLLSLISRFEVWLYRIFYPEIEYAFMMHTVMEKPAVFIGIMVGLPVLIMLFGALFMRYGQKFYWVFWVLWMVSFTVVPRMFSESVENPDSFLGRMGHGLISFMENANKIGLVAAMAVICAASVFATTKLLRRQRVTL